MAWLCKECGSKVEYAEEKVVQITYDISKKGKLRKNGETNLGGLKSYVLCPICDAKIGDFGIPIMLEEVAVWGAKAYNEHKKKEV